MDEVTVEEVSRGVMVGYDDEGEAVFVMTTREDVAAVQEELEEVDDAFYGALLDWREGMPEQMSDEPVFDGVRAWFADGKTVWTAEVVS